MTLTISIADSDAEFVRTEIESGRFGSSSDVVRAALQLLREAEHPDAETLERLRRAFQEGLDSGDAGELDFEAFKLEARARLAARRQGA